MKRDMDLIRDLLLAVEGGQKNFNFASKAFALAVGFPDETGLSDEESSQKVHHINLLQKAGFIELVTVSATDQFFVSGLTWEGHDLVDSIRDPNTWKKTKEGAFAAGGWTFDLLRDLAKGFIKKKMEDTTGIKL
jgi:Hypothetical protein (DUF2513)